jgi:hypothetical protein
LPYLGDVEFFFHSACVVNLYGLPGIGLRQPIG